MSSKKSTEEIIGHEGVASIIISTRLNTFKLEDQQEVLNLLEERDQICNEMIKIQASQISLDKEMLNQLFDKYMLNQQRYSRIQSKYLKN